MNRSGTREAEALAQLQHVLKLLDGSPLCVEAPDTADRRHVLLQLEVIALDPLPEVFGHMVDRIAYQRPSVHAAAMACIGAAPVLPIRSDDSRGPSYSILRKKRLAASRSRLAVRRRSTVPPCLSMARCNTVFRLVSSQSRSPARLRERRADQPEP